ncbi:MAG: cyclic pyranopterin monophosphate synthase MoaC [Gemmatimonadaceae bacterium]
MNGVRATLTHTDGSGKASMVDVGGKAATARTAVASGTIRMAAATLAAVRDNQIAKGDVLGVARIAGIMAAKRTADLIPLCHPVPVTHVDVTLQLDDSIPGVRALGTASTVAQTGIEMEAIVAVSIALTTIYDMAKSGDRAMVIGDIRLESKTGGASGSYAREGARADRNA